MFLAVYVREAHPTDGWRMESNDQVGIAVRQPRTARERNEVAGRCCTKLEMSMPLLVDGLDDRVGHAYSGMPDRLYVIDREGRVAYKSGRGPFGFKPGEMEQSLALLLLDQDGKPGRQGWFPVLNDREAWKRLPAATRGAGQPLPVWARVLAPSLPRTTAAMLELDYLHRARSPLGPVLRGKLRWVAAHANGCAYTEAYAAADLRRAGVDDRAIRALAGDFAGLPAPERAALTFARKLTRAADTVTDKELAGLIRLYGKKKVVAIVLLLAHANFQDRLLTALGVPVEDGGPLPPLEIRFTNKAPPVPPTPRQQMDGKADAGPEQILDKDWFAQDFGQLQQAMEKQRARRPRIPVPSWEEVRKHLPPSLAARGPLRIRWSLVCVGYQPELALGWSACLRTFAEEAKQDRVFEETLFWVITRSLNCFY